MILVAAFAFILLQFSSLFFLPFLRKHPSTAGFNCSEYLFTSKMSTGDLMILSAVCVLLPCLLYKPNLSLKGYISSVGGSFQCRCVCVWGGGVLLLWHIVGQGPVVLAAGAR